MEGKGLKLDFITSGQWFTQPYFIKYLQKARQVSEVEGFQEDEKEHIPGLPRVTCS